MGRRRGRRRWTVGALAVTVALAAGGWTAAPPETDALRDELQAAFRAKSAERAAAVFRDDGIMMQGSRALVGRAGIEEALAEMFSGIEGANPLLFTPRRTETVEGMVVEGGGYGPVGRDPVGRYLIVFRPGEDGAWGIAWMAWTR